MRIFYIVISIIIVYSLYFVFIVGDVESSRLIDISLLIVTAYVIATQSFATKEIATKPSVQVSMIKIKENEGTCFRFSNTARVPARVWLKIELEVDDKKIKAAEENKLLEDPRLTGDSYFSLDLVGYRTSYAYLKKVIEKYPNKIKLILKVFIAPAFQDKRPKIPYIVKSYYYSKDNPQWINEIGMSDPEI